MLYAFWNFIRFLILFNTALLYNMMISSAPDWFWHAPQYAHLSEKYSDQQPTFCQILMLCESDLQQTSGRISKPQLCLGIFAHSSGLVFFKYTFSPKQKPCWVIYIFCVEGWCLIWQQTWGRSSATTIFP